jgi:hypothetical protein
MTDIQKLNFSVSVTQSILNFEISVSCTECNLNHRFDMLPTRYYATNDNF